MQLGPIRVTPPSVAMRAISRSASAPALAGLREARGDGDRSRTPLAPALLEDGSHLMAADGQQRHIGRFGQFLEARVRLQAEERHRLWD